MGTVKDRFSNSFLTGVIALTFLIVGYQTALFVHRAAVVSIAANRDKPDTVYVYRDKNEPDNPPVQAVPRNSHHSDRAVAVRNNVPRKNVESFRFDPNTVSVDELCRLGFSPKQAQSIENYRNKGGRFRRREDFAKSFVVSDSIYKRLEQYIDIPLTDLNLADSVAFDALPGIGGWFASEIIRHRNALGGFSYKEQLMDIYRFDQEKYDALSDLVEVDPEHVTPYLLWELPADSLARHPYIRSYETARAIVLYRDNNPPENCTVEGLAEAGIISSDAARQLSRCFIKIRETGD
jgi:DNA uptake protein ComE-like DNA-binding protein